MFKYICIGFSYSPKLLYNITVNLYNFSKYFCWYKIFCIALWILF